MLEVVWDAADERSVQRQLQEVDPRLFLDKEADAQRRIFYTVKYHEHGFNEPALVLDWREQDGTPKPLSSAVPYEIQRMMRTGGVSLREIIARNEARKHSRDAEFAEAYEDMARDFQKHAAIGNFAVVPRSQGLRMARDKARNRGEKV